MRRCAAAADRSSKIQTYGRIFHIISGILIMNYYMKNIIYIIINIIMKYRIFDFSFQILIIFTLYVYVDKNYQNFRGVGWIFSMDLLLFKVKYKE